MSKPNGQSNGAGGNADFAQAWKELQEGEQQAGMMERNLTALEKKIDDLLAAAESQESEIKAQKATQADSAAKALGDEKSDGSEEGKP